MPGAKIKPDDIIEVLLGERVQKAFVSNTSAALELLNEKFDTVMRSFNVLKHENDLLKSAVKTLETANSELATKNRDYARRCMVRK